MSDLANHFVISPHLKDPTASADDSIPDLSHSVMVFGTDVRVSPAFPSAHLKSDWLPSPVSIFHPTYSHTFFQLVAKSDIALLVISEIFFQEYVSCTASLKIHASVLILPQTFFTADVIVSKSDAIDY